MVEEELFDDELVCPVLFGLDEHAAKQAASDDVIKKNAVAVVRIVVLSPEAHTTTSGRAHES